MIAPLPPITGPIVYDEQGNVWLPRPWHPGRDQETAPWQLLVGLALAWMPLPCGERVLLHMLGGGSPLDRGLNEQGFACSLSRDGLRSIAFDLLAIDLQMEAL